MSVAHRDPDLRDNLADLREESLKTIMPFAGVLAYIWHMWIGHPGIGGSAHISAWIGISLLFLSMIISLALKRRHPGIATHLLVWGILGACACALLSFPSPALAYLFVVPIIFASVLLGQSTLLLVAAVAIVLILTIGPARTGMPLLSLDAMFPIAIIALVTFASWLSVRNLYTALAWVWQGYERARHNEQIARERQAELRRALKALDEATYRLERANYRLALARDQAEEARRFKQQFAQTISHELRTPLNLIVGFTELMAKSPEYYGGQLAPAYLRDLGIVYRNACHLQTLVSDVLDLARIEAAQMSLVPEEIDPAALVQEVVETGRSLVEARGLVLYAEIEPDLPQIRVDPTRIRQVLFNLLNNAARFTEQGSVTVSVRRCKEEVIFAVADTGMGIASEDIPRIFEEFQQADGSTRRRHGGAGLGLAISREFVELHGGRIGVESQMGQGSIFTFSLPTNQPPLEAAPSGRPAEPRRTASAKASEEPILLAVTRSLSAAALLTRYVHGFRTVVVPDLEQARQAARQLMPQLVVIDRVCEKLDPEKLEELAREWDVLHAAFVMCPLPGEEPLRQRLAVDGYLIKPVSRQNVWDVLRQFGENVDSVLVVDDDQDFVLFMSRLLEDNPVRRYQVMSAYSGQEGLAMIRHRPPDLVLLDLMLPDIDGVQIIERVRSDPARQHIPIVVVSAQDELDDQEPLKGSMLIAKADGLMSGNVAQWVQNVADTIVTSFPRPPAPRAVSVP